MDQARETLKPTGIADVLRASRRWSGTLRGILVLLAFSLVLLPMSCIKVHKRQATGKIQPKEDISASPNQIRLRMRSLVDPLAGEIERSADQIAASSPDVAIKRAAIRWKIEGVPALRGALFQPNPFLAVLDTWVLTYQMGDYFESGPGKVALGTSAPVAVETCRNMQGEFAQIVSTFTVSKDVSKVRDFARNWATEHPIRYAIQDRESTLGRVDEAELGSSWTVGETIAELTTTADDVHRELQIYSNHLFRQARWEADLLKLDLNAGEVLPMAERAVKSSEQAVATLDRLAPSIKSAADTASNVPAIIATERESAVNAINDNVTQILTFIHGERLQVLQQVGEDLADVLEHVTHERIAAMQQVSEERLAALQQIREERIAAMSELRDIADSERIAIGRDIEQTGVRLVDHAAWRFAQLLVATFIALLVAAMLFLFLVRRLFFSSGQPDRSLRQHLPAA